MSIPVLDPHGVSFKIKAVRNLYFTDTDHAASIAN